MRTLRGHPAGLCRSIVQGFSMDKHHSDQVHSVDPVRCVCVYFQHAQTAAPVQLWRLPERAAKMPCQCCCCALQCKAIWWRSWHAQPAHAMDMLVNAHAMPTHELLLHTHCSLQTAPEMHFHSKATATCHAPNTDGTHPFNRPWCDNAVSRLAAHGNVCTMQDAASAVRGGSPTRQKHKQKPNAKHSTSHPV